MKRQVNEVQKKCLLHNKSIQFICQAHQCGYYRQLCQICSENDQNHHKNHIRLDLLLFYVEDKLKQFQRKIKITQKLKQQKSSDRQLVLPIQIKNKLITIRQTINKKINKFEQGLIQNYKKEVSQKLQNLDETLIKSQDFFQKHLKKIKKNQYSQLNMKKFFINFDYWQHQNKYYSSYIEEILEKQVTKFKQSFDDDKIIKLNSCFEQNLKQIFTSRKQISEINLNNKYNILQSHLFIQDKLHLVKYERHDKFKIESKKIQHQISNYQPIGLIQSLFYPENNSFYLFGQGSKPSDVIIRYDKDQSQESNFIPFVNMTSKRTNFSICLILDEVYIIGGSNQIEGCLNKCQKLILSKNNKKIYLVSSLEQRSQSHTVCNFKNKYILKFGGISSRIKGVQNKQLFPEIYSIEKEEWKTIRYLNKNNQRLQFGLWPVILTSNQSNINKIIIFGNQVEKNSQKIKNNKKKEEQNQNFRKKFEIQCNFHRTDLQMKIFETTYEMNWRCFLYPQTMMLIEKNKVNVMAKDINSNMVYLQKIKRIL